jgi:iron complex outermembrane recepter protein
MTSFTRLCRVGASSAVVFGSAMAVAAQPANEAPQAVNTIEEIVVTAQRREQSIQDVGTSITAFDAAAIAKLGLNSVTDIARQVPGLQYQAYSPTITIFNLRGISQNDFGDHHEAPVAVYADDVYVASLGAIAGAMYDLQRVEVLRGPQGTLFGRNATGGLLHYISQRPEKTAGGFLNLDAGRFGDLEAEGAVNLPVTDKVATRLSFSVVRHDGIIHNLIGRDANDANQYAARLQLSFKPSETGEVLLKAYGVRNVSEISPSYAWNASCNAFGLLAPGQSCDAGEHGLGAFVGATQDVFGTCPGCDQSGYRNPSSNPFDQSFDRQGIFNRTVYGLTAHVNWDIGSAKLSSVTDYMHLRKRYGEDSDGSPNFQFNFDTYQTYHQFSQELHLSGEQGPLRWIGGIYFLDLNNDDYQDEQVNQTYIGFIVPHQGPKFTLKTRSAAVFGQTEWDFVDHWTLITGARYTHDKKDYDFTEWNGSLTTPLTDSNGQPYVYNSSTNPGEADRTYGAVSGKLELDFKPRHGALYYASINRGTKGGGWSAPSNVPFNPITQQALVGDLWQIIAYKPETLTDYELGTKLTVLDGRARLNADVFYYDYKNYQAFFLQNFTQIIGNVNAKLAGGELELAYVPVDRLTLQLGASALTTRIKNVILPDGTAADRQMPNAPKWTFNALLRYEWPGLGGTWSATVDSKWNARQFLENVNAPVDLQPSYAVTNLRLGYQSGQRWEASAWVRNVTNKYYRIYNLDLSGLGYNETNYGPPRWYGVSLSYHWGS